ncbi:hypothetical protein ACFYNL_38390 [Streptomyces sp. NPDC007808]|uniref:hypothetical protein n=1 Tax=Streptomyces sp. NPDC007808 TaxID=3364779 RepID=UPI00369542C1
MSVGRHFGLVITRMPRMTYVATVRASQDCRFVCSTCYENCWGIHRLHGETVWMCWQCTDLKDNGLTPGRSFHTQPPRALRVGEQLRSPEGVWDVTSPERVRTWKGCRLRQPARVYPAEFEHITRARRNELGSALTSAGLAWEAGGREGSPRSLTYTVTGPRGRQWSVRPVGGVDFNPWEPSSLWQAVRTAPFHRSPALSARSVADHIRNFAA